MDITISEFAKKAHDDANCTYDGKSYYVHIKMVEDVVKNIVSFLMMNMTIE